MTQLHETAHKLHWANNERDALSVKGIKSYEDAKQAVLCNNKIKVLEKRMRRLRGEQSVGQEAS